MIGEACRAHMEACIAVYHTEDARIEGRKVTTCRTVAAITARVEG